MIYVPESAGKTNHEIKIKPSASTVHSRKVRKKSKAPSKVIKQKKSDPNQRILIFLLAAVFIIFFGSREYDKRKLIENKRLAKIEKLRILALENEKIEKKKLKLIAKKNKADKRKRLEKKALINSVSKDKCLLKIEAKLCAPFKKYKDRGYSEGYLKSFGNLILVIDIDSLDKFLEKKYIKKYKKKERSKVMDLAQIEMNMNFHRDYFRTKNDYRIKELVKDKKYFNLIMLVDILDSKIINKIQNINKIDKLTLVAMRDFKYVQHLSLDFHKLKSLKDKSVTKFTYKVFLRSIISRPLEKILEQIVLK